MLNINFSTGLVNSAQYVPSQNCDERPDPNDINLLVVHCIALPPGDFDPKHVDALFTNQLDKTAHPYFADVADLKVSAHLLITREGALRQYVPLHQRAWHAGESQFEGRANCNDYAIGVELSGSDQQPYEAVQYQRLAELTLVLQHRYPAISDQRIVGHETIAPGRKTDPGPSFDWSAWFRLLSRLRAEGTTVQSSILM